MRAIVLDNELRLISGAPIPRSGAGEALVRVIYAGICGTDLEIAKGYAGFRGVPGHEFIGRVVESPEPALLGRRVVGEINVGCNTCQLCLSGDSRHCPARTVLGIKGRNGAFAEFLSLPPANLLVMPDSIPDQAAVFVEPLAAACRILDQVSIVESSTVAIVGDGKLAQLITRVLVHKGCRPTLIGRHRAKLEIAAAAGAATVLADADLDGWPSPPVSSEQGKLSERFEVVIDASGSRSGLSTALGLIRSLGTLVLKTTHHGTSEVDSSKIVVDEITVIGSRCGRFQPAIDLLANGSIDVAALISEKLPLEEAVPVLLGTRRPELKAIIEIG